MATITDVPVVDVTSDNFIEMWPTLLLSIKKSTYIALDLELSGLGNRKNLMAPSVDDRYRNIAEVAKTRSILSLGLSCFKMSDPTSSLHHEQFTKGSQNSTQENEQFTRSDHTNNPLSFLAHTYNITVLCSEDYVVEPKSLQFLIEHGFDFNKQYSKGVPYYKGSDTENETGSISIRTLLSEMINSQKPIVLHNGLIDLIFMYQNFYASLPNKFSSFLADMSDMFSAGIFDTKYMAEFKARMPASYLEYVFRRCHRQNELDCLNGGDHVTITFPSYPLSQSCVTYQSCRLQSDSNEQTCQQFAFHGHCSAGSKCPKSHNISNILDRDFAVQQKKRQRKRKRKRKSSHTSTNSEDTSTIVNSQDTVSGSEDATVAAPIGDSGPEDQAPSSDHNGASFCEASPSGPKSSSIPNYGNHRAGFDAFMTGFAMATFYLTYGDRSKSDFSFSDSINKLSLSGKDMPLLITKSNFAKTSAEHNRKYANILSRNM